MGLKCTQQPQVSQWQAHQQVVRAAEITLLGKLFEMVSTSVTSSSSCNHHLPLILANMKAYTQDKSWSRDLCCMISLEP